MRRTVELSRHTANDGDALSVEGIAAARRIQLEPRYDLLVSTGAQRATQTIACMLASGAITCAAGVEVDPSFRSEVEDRWFAAAKASGGGGLEAFERTDPELVRTESARFGEALRRLLDRLPDGGRALVVGHSPMHECAVYGLTGEIVAPLSKGAAVVVAEVDGRFEITQRTSPA